MGVKERILAIRLLEKAGKHPAYAKALGIEAPDAKPTKHEGGSIYAL